MRVSPAFEKSPLPRTPTRKNFDQWGGGAKGVQDGVRRDWGIGPCRAVSVQPCVCRRKTGGPYAPFLRGHPGDKRGKPRPSQWR